MLRPGHRFGHYRIESVLGEGGMGIVYEATDVERERRVALKVVNPDLALDPDGNQGIEAARRLVREGRAAASLRHPNAVAVLDSGEIDGTPYIAMELARGRALGQFIGDKRIPMDQRVEWLWGMARGLAAAHREGIAHRDVKPENVMVCDDGWVKLFDFGVAKPIADPRASIDLTVVTHTGIVVGTPLYMAPEQVLGDKLDLRSDQYAWATVAYELLTGGTHPITTTAESHLPVPFAILKGTPKAIREVAPQVPQRVADVVMRALSKDPKGRFPAMSEVVELLGRFLERNAEADAEEERDYRIRLAQETTMEHPSETTVAVPAPVLFDDSDVRDTVTLHYDPRNTGPAKMGMPTPTHASAVSSAPMRPRPSYPPSPMSPEPRARAPQGSGMPVSVRGPRSVRPVNERADPAVLSPAPSATDAPLSQRFDPEGRDAPLLATPASPPTRTQQRALASPLPELVKKLLWVPVLVFAAVAGYVTYVLLASH